MTDSAIDAKRKAAEHAIANGGVPLDPYPGYLTWFVRKCVDRGAASGLDWLCRMFPEHEEAILDHWCRLACGPGNLWAWREARARLEVLVSRGEDIPLPLARFAIESPPRDKPGPNPEGSRAVLIDGVMRVLESEGLDAQEVNAQFGASFPGKAKYPGTRCVTAASWVAGTSLGRSRRARMTSSWPRLLPGRSRSPSTGRTLTRRPLRC